MKPTELMIGDCVYFNCFDGSKIIVKITAINNNGLVYGVSEYGSHWCNIDKVEPIPLTHEILERNGFEYKESWDEWWHRCEDGFGSDFRLSVTEDAIYMTGYAKINLVYQLQHALRLCGLNELADNLKLEQ